MCINKVRREKIKVAAARRTHYSPRLPAARNVSKHDCIEEEGGEAKWKPEDDSVVCKQAAGLCVEGMNKESSLSSGREKAA